MTLHKYWNAPVHTADEAPVPVEDRAKYLSEVTPVASALTHVYIGRYEYDGDSKTKAFSTREACVAWRDSLCGDYDKFEIYHREIGN
jgi:hypothetical protein